MIADAVAEAIAMGRLHAGDRVVETTVAEELGVSRVPTREALKASLRESKGAKEIAAPPPVANKKITANLKNLKRDLGKLEQRMFELQTQKHELEARLSTQTPPLSPQEIGELGLKLQTINDTLADCEDQWLLLSEQIEAES